MAWKRVKANAGSAGVDGLTVGQAAEHLKAHWPQVKEELLTGRYRPQPVRRVQIPKPGGGVRELGIPTATDRLIQQALLQVLQPLIDPGFSQHSYGFRPGRRALQAICQAQAYVQAGYRTVVDVDLEKFFDRVNHDVLMDRLSRRIADQAVLRLVRQYLQAGIMLHGVVQERYEGTPQGGPLSPLLANVLLDEVDRELERRAHRFVRYDLKGYVPGWRAYFGHAQPPKVMHELDQWLRHRLRALQLKQWRRGTTAYRELRAMGATSEQAARLAAHERRWWRYSGSELNRLMPIGYFDRLGVPRLS